MIKYYCDKCGKQIDLLNYDKSYITIENSFQEQKKMWDLIFCSECNQEFIKDINNLADKYNQKQLIEKA